MEPVNMHLCNVILDINCHKFNVNCNIYLGDSTDPEVVLWCLDTVATSIYRAEKVMTVGINENPPNVQT